MRELNQPERAEAILTLLRLYRSLERVDTGLTPQQYRILKAASGSGERSARLAEKLAVARPTVTSVADSLVNAGLAVREAEPGDRRVVRLCLTRAGREAVARADKAYAAWLDRLLELTPIPAAVTAMLHDLSRAMDESRARHQDEHKRRHRAAGQQHARRGADASAHHDPAGAQDRPALVVLDPGQ